MGKTKTYLHTCKLKQNTNKILAKASSILSCCGRSKVIMFSFNRGRHNMRWTHRKSAKCAKKFHMSLLKCVDWL